ncbi:hypothetical protein IX39_18835 [Chryseobacterium formosense]|uniref:Uncharacterized protein n=1 Tax=Chryseobacterium formosense TaxID=236814 RepID=A0A085Z049_9FLAO|nr:hypothetical protein IX39_18835 [Chryseobacterium formosense]
MILNNRVEIELRLIYVDFTIQNEVKVDSSLVRMTKMLYKEYLHSFSFRAKRIEAWNLSIFVNFEIPKERKQSDKK